MSIIGTGFCSHCATERHLSEFIAGGREYRCCHKCRARARRVTRERKRKAA